MQVELVSGEAGRQSNQTPCDPDVVCTSLPFGFTYQIWPDGSTHMANSDGEVTLISPRQTPPPRLTESDWADAAERLGTDVSAIKTVAHVESASDPFLPDGRPAILFERHVFSRLTDHLFDRTYSDLSARNWEAGTYGAGGAHQWERLDAAARLDATAALESASYGRFQIMGFNYRAAGYHSAAAFVLAMHHSEQRQLDAFVSFIQNNRAAHTALRRHDWDSFARAYNGPGQVSYYAGRMRSAYGALNRGN